MATVFRKFLVYLLLKWSIFYIYQFSGTQTIWNWKHTNSEGVLLAALMLLAMPLTELVLFFFPVLLALRQKSWIMLLILIQVLGLEFLMGWLFTNQQLALWMVVKILLSAGLFVLIFRKQLQQSNTKHPLISAGPD
jgi:hypothetical protein